LQKQIPKARAPYLVLRRFHLELELLDSAKEKKGWENTTNTTLIKNTVQNTRKSSQKPKSYNLNT